MRYRLLYSFLLITGCSSVYCQSFPQLHFRHLGERDGLSYKQATAIIQDDEGFMWFGTVNGFNRYDGYRFKTFYHSAGDTSTIPNNNISAVYPAAAGAMWVSTKGGLALFGTHTYSCRNIVHTDNADAVKSDDDIHPYTGTDGSTWLFTYKGLYALQKDFSVKETDEGVEPFSFYQEHIKYYKDVCKDRKGNLWSYAGNRIYLLNTVSKKVERTFIAPDKFHITSLFFDDDNNCLFTMWGGNGLYKLDTGSSLFSRINLGPGNRICVQVKEWRLNNKKYFVVATLGNGIFLIDPQTMQYRNYLEDASGRRILSDMNVNAVYEDRQHNLWLATDNGIDYISASSSLYEIISISNQDGNRVIPLKEGRIVKNFFETASGYWAGSWLNGGTFYYSKNWQLQQFFPVLCGSKPNLTAQSYGTLQWNGSLYFSTDSGIVKTNLQGQRPHLFHPGDTRFSVDMRNIVPVNDTVWWVRSHIYGIYVFDPVKEKFTRHYSGKDSCSSCLPVTHYEYLLKDRAGTLWLTTEAGLYQYLPGNDSFKNWRSKAGRQPAFPSDKLSGMAEDSAGNLWIGTESGICMFNPHTGRVEKVFKENTYISIVFRVCTDDHDNVWFNSRTGIWCWIRRLDKLVQFNTAGGLPGGYELGVMEKAADGKIYAGCDNALVCFDPLKLMQHITAAADAKITEAAIENRFIPVGFGNEKKLVLLPGEKTFSIDFTVLDYDQPGNNEYFYRLLSHSEEWVENNSGHLNFYNLAPGTHRLEVRGKNKAGNVFGTADTILIIVKPYWYQTIFFKTGLGLLLLFAGYFFYRWRIRTIKKQAAVKQEIAETEMQALRAQMNPHFIFNSLNSIENFIMKNEKRQASDYLNKFARLVRMILDSSRNEVVPLAKDMEALQLYVDLEQLRFSHTFTYETYIDPVLLGGDYRVPSLVIQPYVENAIVHGLAHSEKKGLSLTVMISLENDRIKYKVQDNGVGRSMAAAYNMQNKPLHKSVGLKITEDRINLFNGATDGSSAVKFTDLYNNNNEPAGTKVEITIKAK